MDKYVALANYLSMNPRIRLFKERVEHELCEVVEAWKADEFAPPVTELDNLSDSDFLTAYSLKYKDTVEHELAEAIEHIYLFAHAHGVDILAYLPYLDKYRTLMKAQKAIPAVSPIITPMITPSVTPSSKVVLTKLLFH